MNISEVRVRLVKKDEGKLKAVASITIDNCFVVHDVKILEGSDDFFIAMPSKKTPDGEYKDIVHPLNTETREMLKKVVLEEFEKVKSQVAIDEQQSADSGASELFRGIGSNPADAEYKDAGIPQSFQTVAEEETGPFLSFAVWIFGHDFCLSEVAFLCRAS